MIRFAERQVRKILSGEKKFTRINVPCPWTSGEVITAVHLVDEIDRPFATLKIARIIEHKLGELSDDDARLEGYSSRAEFLTAWEAIHGSANVEEKVWAIEFELVRHIGDEELSFLS